MARKAVPDSFKVFPERLSSLMKEKNLRQQDLADFLGVKRQTVSLYMTGQSIPDAEQLKNIAVFFKVSSDWLIGITEDKSTQNRAVDMLGISTSAIDGLLEASHSFPGILSDLFSNVGFLGFVSTIYRLQSAVNTTKQAHKVVQEKGYREYLNIQNALKSLEKELKELLGYPISFVEPRHALYYCLDEVKMSAENLAKDISGYNSLSISERIDDIYDFNPTEIESFFNDYQETT